MLDAKLFRSELMETAGRLKETSGYILDVAALEALETQRKELQVRAESLQAERNARSKEIAQAKAQEQDIAPLLAEMAEMRSLLEAAKKASKQPQEELY